MRMIRNAFTLLMAGSLSVLPGCALRKGPPDPAKVQQKIENAKNSEQQLVMSTLQDPERILEMMDLFAERDRLVADHAEAVEMYRDRMQTLNSKYDASREEFEQAIAEYNEFRSASQRRFIDLIARMKAATTAEEWKKLSKFQLKKLNPRDLTYSEEGS